VDTGTAYDEAWQLARQLAAGPTIAIGMIKRATYQSARSDLRTALNLISSEMGVVRVTEDSREAFESFRERRDPVFQGN
jgi:enoyl-CoA hydratase/carnithine racemase